MKKSHRKDVILARIIFGVFCLLVAAAIVGLIFLVKNNRTSGKPDTEQTQGSQTEPTQGEPSEETEDTEPASEEPSQEESRPVIRTTTRVNLRVEPNTSCEVITTLAEGTQLEMLGEEDGWAVVEYQGRTGYVSVNYIEEVTPET